MSDLNKFYTGVGSRSAPTDVLKYITKLAERLESIGFILRTGDATGCDSAFIDGATNYESYSANDAKGDNLAFEMAKSLHPNWNACSPYVKLLHARNCYQVLGHDLSNPVKSDFLICWTPNGSQTELDLKKYGKDEGGTGMAIRLACRNDIPVFNLKNGPKELYSYLKYNLYY